MSLTRREFLKASGATLAGLCLELAWDGRLLHDAESAAEPAAGFRPYAWLAIESDGRTVIQVGRVEMGQGVRTSLPMILAEELDADWSRVEVVTASPGPDFKQMTTSGSWSVGGTYMPLRHMGARARALLIQAAAARWQVDPASCRTEPGRVLHPATDRSLSYGELAAEAARLPIPTAAPLKEPGAFRLIGRRMPRLDAPRIVSGAAGYGLDVRIPDMKFASIERCPVPGGMPRSVDDAAARAVPGVRDVVRLAEGVAVVGDHTWAALAGRRALRVEWNEGAIASFDSDAYRRSLVEASSGAGSVGRSVGDVDGALTGAARRLDALYEYPFFVHAPIEPMNAVAHVREGACDVWTGTQAPNWAQAAVAERLALDPSAVRVHVPLLGGGFGRRLGVEYAVEAAELSRALGAPVQVLWTRADDMSHGFFQPAAAHRMAAGLDAAGRIVGWWHREASSAQNYRGTMDPQNPELAAIHMWGGVDNPYVFPAMRAEFMLEQAPIRLGPWRAVFAPSNVIARECFLDEIAQATGRDPVALRLDLLAADAGADDAQKARRQRLAAVLRLAAEKAGWGRALAPGHAMGIAAHIYDGETTLAQVAEVSIERGAPRVHRFVCAIDCGPVINPLGLEAQVESAVVWGLCQVTGGQITIRQGRVQETNFVDYPILRYSETPVIETHSIAGAPQPLGAGEQPVAPVAAAVLNALSSLTGKRLRRLPVTAGDLG